MATRRTNYPRAGLSRDVTIAALVLVLVVLVVGGLWLVAWLRPERYSARALFNINSDELSETGKPIEFDERRFEILQRTQVAYLKSFFVVQAALREPGIGALAVLAPHEDKVQWVIDNLDVGYEQNSELLSIELSGTEDQSEDLRAIVDALCAAYLKEVVFEDEQRQLVVRDSKERSAQALRAKLERLIEVRNKLTDDSPETKAKLEAANIEIAALTEYWRAIVVGMERDAFQDQAPDRIRLIQKATVTSENDPSRRNQKKSRD